MSRVKLDGGSGNDGAAWEDVELKNIFDQSPSEKSIEHHSVDVAAMAAYMADEETGFGLILPTRATAETWRLVTSRDMAATRDRHPRAVGRPQCIASGLTRFTSPDLGGGRAGHVRVGGG